MKYIRLMSGIGFWVDDEIANAISNELKKNKAKFIELGGNVIPIHQFAGIFDEDLGDDLIAKDRGLVRGNGDYVTPQELLGRSLVRYSLDLSESESVKLLEKKLTRELDF